MNGSATFDGQTLTITRAGFSRQGKFDENTILIGPRHVKTFEALTAEINAAKAAPPAPVVVEVPAPAPATTPAPGHPPAPAPASTPAPAPATTSGGGSAGEVVSQLRGVGEMHHRGVLDDEAFIREMHRLLPLLPRS